MSDKGKSEIWWKSEGREPLQKRVHNIRPPSDGLREWSTELISALDVEEAISKWGRRSAALLRKGHLRDLGDLKQMR